MDTKNTYVIVMHKETGRAFSLDRAYHLKDRDLGIINCPQNFVDRWDGWLPTAWHQLPEWVQKNIKTLRDLKDQTKNFEAYWLF